MSFQDTTTDTNLQEELLTNSGFAMHAPCLGQRSSRSSRSTTSSSDKTPITSNHQQTIDASDINATNTDEWPPHVLALVEQLKKRLQRLVVITGVTYTLGLLGTLWWTRFTPSLVTLYCVCYILSMIMLVPILVTVSRICLAHEPFRNVMQANIKSRQSFCCRNCCPPFRLSLVPSKQCFPRDMRQDCQDLFDNFWWPRAPLAEVTDRKDGQDNSSTDDSGIVIIEEEEHDTKAIVAFV